jgi:hypothetical protein
VSLLLIKKDGKDQQLLLACLCDGNGQFSAHVFLLTLDIAGGTALIA